MEPNKDKQLATNLDKKLNKRQWKFIELVNKGLSIPEAYKLAGYKGTNPQQPYQLNHELKNKIAEIAEDNGFNRNNLMIELNRLLAIPLEDSHQTVSLREKLSILRTLAKCLPEVQQKSSTISRFTIVNNVLSSPNSPNVPNAQVIDVQEDKT